MIPQFDLDQRLQRFAIARRADGDYAETTFRCPTTGRGYASTRPPIPHDEPGLPYVASYCYWCDTHGRQRGAPDFDRDHGQPHINPLVDASTI